MSPKTVPPAPDPGQVSEPWLSVEQIAVHLGVRKDSVYRWIESRGLPAHRIGKLWKLKLSEVDAWVRAQDPREREADEPRGRTGPASTAAARSILVIDDDELVRMTLRDFLADEGHAAVLATDGKQALQLLRSGAPRPDLILLDLAMPNLDGRQFRDEQARDPALAAIPTIVVTADRSTTLPGAGAVLRKPIDLDHLASAIDRLLTPERS